MAAIRILLLRLVLRVPVLHRTVSRRFLLLTAVDGSRVSPPAPVRYATHEGDLIALGTERAPWWRRLPTDGTAPVEVTMAGRSVPMQAGLATGEALDEAVLRYLQKYPGEWRSLGVDTTATPADVETAAHAKPVVLLRPR